MVFHETKFIQYEHNTSLILQLFKIIYYPMYQRNNLYLLCPVPYKVDLSNNKLSVFIKPGNSCFRNNEIS